MKFTTITVTNLDNLRIRPMGDISRNFSRSEFACKCKCGFSTVDIELIKVLEIVRGHFDAPVTVNSACRCELHNTAIGGSYGSKHKQGIAADITVMGVKPYAVYRFLDGYAPNKYGLGLYETFTHLDIRKLKARWKG